MGAELKDCIDVAHNMTLKKGTLGSEINNRLSNLKELIINEWRYEVSTIANNDLQQKMWNKPSLIPLAEDLTTLKSYLLSEGLKYRSVLEQNPPKSTRQKGIYTVIGNNICSTASFK
jgi:hypothetical protein